MGGMSDRAATALLIIVVGATMLMCLCYAAIFVQPEIVFNPYPPSDATARVERTLIAMNPIQTFATPRETPTNFFPPTWTPTVTPTPSVTPTATDTRTPTPTSTFTPTPTPFPTKTPTPTNTATPLPPPPPTATTAPPLYVPFNIRTENSCSVNRIFGRVFDANGLPLGGVVMQVGEVGVAGSVFNTSPSDANGRYVFDFGSPNDDSHTWFVVPLENGEPAVKRYEFTTDSADVCELTASIQIVSVDWRRRAD
jgi:hypothetical protein